MEQPKCYVIDTRQVGRDIATKLAQHSTLVKVAGISFVVMVGVPDVLFASSGIDEGANKIYTHLLNVGRWVIIGKGAIDTIKNVAEGDLQSAKHNFLSYILIYVILKALPWGLKQIDEVF